MTQVYEPQQLSGVLAEEEEEEEEEEENSR